MLHTLKSREAHPPDMEPAQIEAVQADLVAWAVLEPDAPVRFTRRFRGALARAAAQLQAAETGGTAPPGSPVERQAEAALAGHLAPEGIAAGPGHRAFVVAVHVTSMPDAVRKLLGV